MKKFKQLAKIKEIYDKGQNVIKYLKSGVLSRSNEIEDILISYDFQSGTYIKKHLSNPDFLGAYSKSISNYINKLGNVNSIMEVGVGEGTTLNGVIDSLAEKPNQILGFDISWSRLNFAKYYLNEKYHKEVNLFVANLFNVPLADNAIDVVYTSHSIEPNGGKEKEALLELYRVCNKYLVLLEPSYELAGEQARKRMKEHGYVTKLVETSTELGFNIIEHRLFDYSSNPLNPTGLIVIEKESPTEENNCKLKCPITLTSLTQVNDHLLFSNESYLSYPVINGIPCLISDNAILTSHLMTDIEAFLDKDKEGF